MNQCVANSPYSTIPEHIRKILNTCNLPQTAARSTMPMVIPLPAVPNSTQTKANQSKPPLQPLTLIVPTHPWHQVTASNRSRPVTVSPATRSPVTPVTPVLASATSAASTGGPIVANSRSNAQHEELKQKLDIRTKQLNYVQKAYWTLKADFDRVCKVINERKSVKSVNPKLGNRGKSESSSAAKLRSISEDEPIDYAVNDLQQKLKVKDAKLMAMRQSMDNVMKQREQLIQHNASMKEEIHCLRMKMKQLEKSNQRLSKVTVSATQKRRIRKKTLSELYLNSNRIKEFMTAIGKYGKLYQGLKTRQKNLIDCVGNEDTEILKIRMKDLYDDIVGAEGGYQDIREALDRMKIESQGKEFELMTKDKEYILSLEKAKCLQSSHLEEYVKRNQSLQTDLVDREMKLRQALNELNYLQQRVGYTVTVTGSPGSQ